MSAGSGNQSTKTTDQAIQATASSTGAQAPNITNSGNGALAVRYLGEDNSTKVGDKAVVQAAGATSVNLSGDRSYYSPTTNTTTNITGIDPAAALTAIGQLQLNAANGSGGSGGSTVVIPGAAAPDLSGLGNSISNAITGALGGGGGTAGKSNNAVLWLIGAAVLLIGGFLFFKRK